LFSFLKFLLFFSAKKPYSNFKVEDTNSISPFECSKSKSFEKIKLEKRSHLMESKILLKDWFNLNVDNPYPDQKEKIELSKKTNLNLSQIESWFKYQRLKRKKQEIKN
jgi:hypothetical protein